MRLLLMLVLGLAVASSSGTAGDYIRLDIESLPAGGQDVVLPFNAERTCPEPDYVTGIANAFYIAATGDVTWTYKQFLPCPESSTWFNLGGMLFLDGLTGTSTYGEWKVGGAGNPPDGGMPIFDDQLIFSLVFDLGPGLGEICIDSAFIGVTTWWTWSGLTCGQGGAPDRPLFLDKYGSDESHPVCIVVHDPSCVPPEINLVPPANELVGSHCDDLIFGFEAYAGLDGEVPATIVEWSVVSGIGAIDGNGNYSIGPMPIGTYPVTIQVINSCGQSDTYSFDVESTNSEPYFTNCLNNCGWPDWYTVPFCYTFSCPLSVEDADPCDELSFAICNVQSSGGGVPFAGTVSLDSNILILETTCDDGDVQLCVDVCVEDGEGGGAICQIGYDICCFNCGDVDHLGGVDIDDVVFLVNYVFLSGWPPEPYHLGDVNCDTVVDIDDIVYMAAYIFSSGPEPCADCQK